MCLLCIPPIQVLWDTTSIKVALAIDLHENSNFNAKLYVKILCKTSYSLYLFRFEFKLKIFKHLFCLIFFNHGKVICVLHGGGGELFSGHFDLPAFSPTTIPYCKVFFFFSDLEVYIFVFSIK